MSTRVFLSYAPTDEPCRAELEKQLAPLCRDGAAVVWDDRQVAPGEDYRAALEAQLDAADVILLLVTADLLASDALHAQAQRAMQRALAGGARVVPVLVRPCAWQRIPALAGLQPLPRNGVPVASWPDRDAAWLDVVEGVASVIAERGAGPGASTMPGGRAIGVFVGREKELGALREALLPAEGAPRPVAVCALHGMPGVGKSYLADRFAAENAAHFPGGAVRVVLDPGESAAAPSVDSLLASIARQVGLPERPDATAIAARLRSPRTLLHIENADSYATAGAAATVAERLSPGAILITGRYREIGKSLGFGQVNVPVLPEAQSLELLEELLGEAIRAEERPAVTELVSALGHLPLALSLAADYLREGYSPGAFLELLRSEDYQVAPLDPAHPALLADQARAIVGRAFALSIDTLRRTLGKDADRLVSGFFALGHAPAAGFGASLGAAIAGLTEGEYLRMATAASRHSLLDRVAGERGRWAVHPLVAEMGRARSDGAAALSRMTDWFVERLDPAIDANGVPRGPRWAEVRAEMAVLPAWLAALSARDCARVVVAGSLFAIRYGPFDAWQRPCEHTTSMENEPEANMEALFTLACLAQRTGELDRALSLLNDNVALARSRDLPEKVARAGRQISGLLLARGELIEAMRVLQEETLSVFEGPGKPHQRADALRLMSDILWARGERGEALRMLRAEILPIFEQLGDERERAVTQGKIADILALRGELTEAFRIRREETLPVYEKCGDERELAMGRTKLALLLTTRNAPGDRREARQLLRLARDAAQRLRIPEAAEIREWMALYGLED